MPSQKFINQWKDRISVASERALKDGVIHSGHDFSIESAARAWLAFRALNDGKNVEFNPSHSTHADVEEFKSIFKNNKSLLQKFRDMGENRINVWAAENPHNLVLILRSDAEIMRAKTGMSIDPKLMHFLLGEIKGLDGVAYMSPDRRDSHDVFRKLFTEAQEDTAIEFMARTTQERTRQFASLDFNRGQTIEPS